MSRSIHDLFLEKFPSNPSEKPYDDSGKTFGNDTFESLLKNFNFKRILKINPKLKQICLECIFDDEPAIIILEKNPFDENLSEKIAKHFGQVIKNGKNLFRNDIYGSYLIDFIMNDAEDNSNLNKIFMSLIHPASPKDIEKYLDHRVFLIRETAEMYEKFTKPYIQEQIKTVSHLQWVYNILDGKAEVERVIYSDPDFMIVKDMKWKCDHEALSETEKTGLYANAFVVRRDLHSLRDLRKEHLPLLNSIYNLGRDAISKKYSIPSQEIRVFIHYQPSFYHLHVHFTHIKNEHHGFQCERAFPLSNVIENIRLMGDYYQKITLEFALSEASKLSFY